MRPPRSAGGNYHGSQYECAQEMSFNEAPAFCGGEFATSKEVRDLLILLQ